MAPVYIRHAPKRGFEVLSCQKVGRVSASYIELKAVCGDNGPASIGRVTFSKTGQTIYYCGKTLRHVGKYGLLDNYAAGETGEEYWISGPQKNDQDCHWAGSGAVIIDGEAAQEHRAQIRGVKSESEAF